MIKMVGVTAGVDVLVADDVVRFLKRCLLLFDVVTLGDEFEEGAFDTFKGRARSEIDWLREQGLLQTGLPADVAPQVRSFINSLPAEQRDAWLRDINAARLAATRLVGELAHFDRSPPFGELPFHLRNLYLEAVEVMARVNAVVLQAQGTEATLLLPTPVLRLGVGVPRQAEVTRIILHSLPVPRDDIPWEAIIDYRADPVSRTQLIGLKHWMNALARSDKPLKELQDELEYLISRYEEHMRLHRLKFERGAIESFVTIAASSAENLLRLKFGEFAKGLFSVRKERIALLEAEYNAPGREVAFVVDARRHFG